MKVILTETFKKQLKKLDAVISKRVLDYLEQIELLDNPRSRGKALTSNLSGLWRYRVGNYRILCRINDVIRTSQWLGYFLFIRAK
ncbi:MULTISPECIES: type II toxin-antitoxin system RelE family toxin [Treponema]|uniref:type II toxin-antitoxin system RelE family toxin n=1 Tax=Treponema TaxID=157 RepID=UPI0002B5CCE6|nr:MULTISPECIES: type II toxin-antitoxin system RelE/ParE family toxin [Treponema]EMB47969.1 RelE/StbE family addiction module toxin [Treponema denticola ASLM]EMD56024.1 RelE/StbE family addiction module toxin [Treponema denticola US-Trep]UTD09660.1 type II toxin-antitoxin system RelE/ParE family toxin [Treponema sp. B152]